MIEHHSDVLQVDVLINPEIQTFNSKLRSFLKKNANYRHIIYSGHCFHGSGSWVLQDDWFSFSKFLALFKEPDVDAAIKQQTDKILALSVFSEGDWVPNNLAKHSFGKILEVRINPGTKLDSINGVLQFSAYLSYFVNPVSVKQLLKASDVVGNIRFSRPTLYIFPGFQGDSALFGISGFNLLVNGGYGRKACFWDFARHLDRIDALLLSHLSEDNLFGASAALERKAQENVHPEIGFVYFNALDEKLKSSPNGDIHPEDGGSHKLPSLSVDLIQEGNKMIENIKCINQEAHPCLGKNLGTTLQPINLYHKVGHGSLDMYVLNPLQDNKEMKEFLAQWGKHASTFSSKNGIPLPHLLSIAALLVWKPSLPSEKITRILFPGSVPQAKLFDGMDKLKTVEMFKHAECSEESLKAPPASKVKKATGGRMPPVQKPPPASSVGRTARKDKESSEAKEATVSERKKPIAKPDAGKSRITKKADKKTTTKGTADSDTKSTSSVGTPPPVSVEEVVSPAESTSTHDSTVLAESEATNTVEVKEAEKAEIPELVPVEIAEKSNGTVEASEESILDTRAENLSVESKSPISEKYEQEESIKENESQPPSEFDQSSITHDTNASTVTDVGKSVEEAVDDKFAPASLDAKPITVDDVHLEEKPPMVEAQHRDEGLFESPDALPDPELLKDQGIHAETDEFEPQVIQSVKDDEKDIDTTEFNVNPPNEGDGGYPGSEHMGEDIFMKEQSGIVNASSNLVDISPSKEQDMFDRPIVPGDVSMDPLEEEKVQSEEREEDGQLFQKVEPVLTDNLSPANQTSNPTNPVDETESSAEGLLLPEADISPVETNKGVDSQDLLSDVADVPADYNFDNLSDDGSKGHFDKADGNQLQSETFKEDSESKVQSDPAEAVEETADGVAGETGPFDGARPEGLPLPQEPDVSVAEPCELEEDVIKMSEKDPADELDFQKSDDGVTCVDSDPSTPLDDVMTGKDEVEKESEQLDNVNVDVKLKTEETTAAEADNVFKGDFKTPNEESVNVNDSEFMRNSEAENQDQFTSEEVSTTDIMKDSIENTFPEEDSLNVSKDSLLDGDSVSETVPTARFEEISDAPKDIPVPECDLSSPTNPFMGMSPGEPTESQMTDENGEHIPFAAETPPSESIAEPDSLMEDLHQPQHDLPHDLLGQFQQVNANLADFSQTDVQYRSEDNQNVHPDDSLQEFDPLKEWGQPMGLPAPTADSAKAGGKSPRPSGKPTPSKTREGPTKSGSRLSSAPAERRAAAEKDNVDKKSTTKTKVGAKKPSSAPLKSGASKGMEGKADITSKPASGKTDEAKKASSTTSKRMSMGVGKRGTPPMKEDHSKEEKKPPSKLTTSKRPATSSTTKVTAPPVKLLPVVPFYVDLTYIPHHGDSDYVNINYFRRVRARYYVYSALRPDVNVLQSLLDAKQTWDDASLEVTVIPTYDTEALRLWITQNREKLASLKVDIAPSASRCTIQLQDHETSCAAYRLEF